MSTLNVTIVQADLHWQDPAANRDAFAAIIRQLEESTDLIVLPEMFTTGFSMDAPKLAESMDGPSVTWMQETAATNEVAVCGSLIIVDNENYYNRFICSSPTGELSCYDKRHLFRLADEQQHYAAGKALVTFTVKGWRVCPQVCYDLRFPVWSRNQDGYDLLLYVANWPKQRHVAWETLLRARAIENLSFVVGVNRVGTDGNELPYGGGSAIVDYVGQELSVLHEEPGSATASLDMHMLKKFRDRFAFHKDADQFSINI